MPGKRKPNRKPTYQKSPWQSGTTGMQYFVGIFNFPVDMKYNDVISFVSDKVESKLGRALQILSDGQIDNGVFIELPTENQYNAALSVHGSLVADKLLWVTEFHPELQPLQDPIFQMLSGTFNNGGIDLSSLYMKFTSIGVPGQLVNFDNSVFVEFLFTRIAVESRNANTQIIHIDLTGNNITSVMKWDRFVLCLPQLASVNLRNNPLSHKPLMPRWPPMRIDYDILPLASGGVSGGWGSAPSAAGTGWGSSATPSAGFDSMAGSEQASRSGGWGGASISSWANSNANGSSAGSGGWGSQSTGNSGGGGSWGTPQTIQSGGTGWGSQQSTVSGAWGAQSTNTPGGGGSWGRQQSNTSGGGSWGRQATNADAWTNSSSTGANTWGNPSSTGGNAWGNQQTDVGVSNTTNRSTNSSWGRAQTTNVVTSRGKSNTRGRGRGGSWGHSAAPLEATVVPQNDSSLFPTQPFDPNDFPDTAIEFID